MKACKLWKSSRAIRKQSVRSALNGNKDPELDMTNRQAAGFVNFSV